MNKLFWYSVAEKSLVELCPAEAISAVQDANGCSEGVAQALRVESLEVIPALPIWVYGTLLKGEAKHSLIQSLALPEFKPMNEVKCRVIGYKNPHVSYPAAKLSDSYEDKLYMERYLIRPSDLHYLDAYEGAPDLYSLVEIPDGTGYFYQFNLGLEEWSPLSNHDWRFDK